MNQPDTLYAAMQSWIDKEQLPTCTPDCNKEKVQYVCNDKNCKNNKQVFFCLKCLNTGKHPHFPLLLINEASLEIDKRWGNLLEFFKNVVAPARESY